jgi:hypothetical protein
VSRVEHERRVFRTFRCTLSEGIDAMSYFPMSSDLLGMLAKRRTLAVRDLQLQIMLAGAGRRSFMVLQGFDCWQAKPRATESWCYYRKWFGSASIGGGRRWRSSSCLTNNRLGGRSGVAGCEAK